jgi:hypothetical protein
MVMKVKLNDVIDALEFVNSDTHYFFSIKAEDILMVWDGMVNGEPDPEAIEEIEENFDEYIAFPGQYEIDEYSMMEEFVENLPGCIKKIELSDSLQGRGAFRRFKDTIYDLGLEQKWYKFRKLAYEQVARNWCEENGIEIIKDK